MDREPQPPVDGERSIFCGAQLPATRLPFLVFSETLTSIQLGGAALVVAAAATIGRMAT
jgi:drug/metabolite transporter (DMT)-like permease